MDMKKILTILIVLILSLNFIFSTEIQYTLADTAWEGYIIVNLDKAEFNSDEEITGHLLIENGEHFPLIGQRVILQLAKGEYYYPSQYSKDNIISEQFFEDQWILPRTLKRIDFSFGKVEAGKYHIDAYSWVLKSMFVGSDAILFNPASANFIVNGEEKKDIYINRELTNFGKDNVVGPVGFLQKPNEPLLGKIYFTNDTDITKSNLKLEIQICDWSASFCKGELFNNSKEKTIYNFNLPQLKANETTEFNLELISPSIPSAYEINIILKENEKILSIYKNRIIVEGGTSKLRKILFDGLKYKDYSIEILFSGSPDHFTFPDFEDFKLKMSVFNKDQIVDEKEETYSLIKTGEVKSKKFNIEPKNFDKICVEINKNNLVYDKECFKIDLDGLVVDYDEAFPELMKIQHSYDKINEELQIILSKEISNKLNGKIRLLGANNLMVINEEVNFNGIYEKSFFIKKDNYTLIIDDFDSKQQKVIYLNLNETDTFAREDDVLNSCAGQICPVGTVCSSKTYISTQGDCCTAQCIPSTESEGILGILTTPLIFWIAILLILISGIILFNIVKNRGRKK